MRMKAKRWDVGTILSRTFLDPRCMGSQGMVEFCCIVGVGVSIMDAGTVWAWFPRAGGSCCILLELLKAFRTLGFDYSLHLSAVKGVVAVFTVDACHSQNKKDGL